MGARYYDAALGRFISADTIIADFGNRQSLNRYSYVYNNPVSNTALTGHKVCDPDSGCEGPQSSKPNKGNTSTNGSGNTTPAGAQNAGNIGGNDEGGGSPDAAGPFPPIAPTDWFGAEPVCVANGGYTSCSLGSHYRTRGDTILFRVWITDTYGIRHVKYLWADKFSLDNSVDGIVEPSSHFYAKSEERQDLLGNDSFGGAAVGGLAGCFVGTGTLECVVNAVPAATLGLLAEKLFITGPQITFIERDLEQTYSMISGFREEFQMTSYYQADPIVFYQVDLPNLQTCGKISCSP